MNQSEKIAIIHDWFIEIGGAEKTVKEIFSLFPKGKIYTLLAKEETLKKLKIPLWKVKTCKISRLPKIEAYYRNLFFLFPWLIEQFNLEKYKVIISSSHAVAKGVLSRADQLHVCYCYTPVRYIWDLYNVYLKNLNIFKKTLVSFIFHYIRMWDFVAAQRVDYFIAISKHVARRIKKIYKKEAKIIYPPVEIEKFNVNFNKENFYITVSRLVPYKRVDLLVRSFTKLPDKKLIIIGDGPELKKLKKMASKNIEFLGRVNFYTLKNYLEKAKAFIFAGEEDFGMAMVEAQACGTPVIAYKKGGAEEIVIPYKTGLLFEAQKETHIIESIKKFEKIEGKFDPVEIRKNSERFDKKVFHQKFKKFIQTIMEKHKE